MHSAVLAADVNSVPSLYPGNAIPIIHGERREAESAATVIGPVALQGAIIKTDLGHTRDCGYALLNRLHPADPNLVDQVGTKNVCFAQPGINPIIAFRLWVSWIDDRFVRVLVRLHIGGDAVAKEE